jgi:hypothetical protein
MVELLELAFVDPTDPIIAEFLPKPPLTYDALPPELERLIKDFYERGNRSGLP